MKHKRLLSVVAAVMIICFLVTGSVGNTSSTELTEMVPVIAVGLDSAKKGQTALTMQAGYQGDSQTSKDQGGSEDKFLVYKKTGDSVFDMLRDTTHESSHRLFMGHNQCLIFGKEEAKRGVKNQIDFFTRNPSTRMDVWILVSDSTAENILSAKTEGASVPALDISQLLKMQKINAESVNVDLLEFSSKLASETTSPVASIIKVNKESGKPRFVISGTAVFKKDKLAGELDEDKTRGFLWTMNQIQNGVVQVNVGKEKAGLEILKSKCQSVPEVHSDGTVSVSISVSTNLGVREMTEFHGFSDKEILQTLQSAAEKIVKKKMLDCFHETQRCGADIYGIGKLVYEKYPGKWEPLKGKWEQVYKKLQPQITVQVQIKDMGKITHIATD
jgi:spore germination protein KC